MTTIKDPDPVYPSRDLDKYVMRFPEGMRARIADAAKAAKRTMNAEIIARLEESFGPAPEIPSYLADRIEEAAKRNGRTFHAEVVQRLMDTEDVLVAWLREAVDPFRAELQDAAEDNGISVVSEIKNRLRSGPSASYGLHFTIRSEADLSIDTAIAYANEIVDKWPHVAGKISTLTVRIITPPSREDADPAE